MKKMLKKSVAAVLSAVLSVGIFLGTSSIVTPKKYNELGGKNFYRAKGFLAEDDYSLDCIVFGNSDAYSGFSPEVFDEKTSMYSYVSAKPGQEMGEIDVLLEKALKKQKPKLVILEMDVLSAKSTLIKSRAEFFTRLFVYHGRWKQLTKEDFKTLPPKCLGKDENRGYVLNRKEKPVENRDYMINSEYTSKISLRTKINLKLFVDECKEHGVQVLFVKLPSTDRWNTARSNAIKAYSEELGVTFIDMNLLEDYQIDFDRDFRDGGNHMNINGAEKASEYLGRYVTENMKLN